jgi:hypothetical protein
VVSDEIGQPKRAAFLAAIAECPSISRASKSAKISRSTHYEWLKDQEYKKAFEVAWERGKQALHDKAVERAQDGQSDTLLIFLLKGAYPETYRERWDGHLSGKDGGPIDITDGASARETLLDRVRSLAAQPGGNPGGDDGGTMPGTAA